MKKYAFLLTLVLGVAANKMVLAYDSAKLVATCSYSQINGSEVSLSIYRDSDSPLRDGSGWIQKNGSTESVRMSIQSNDDGTFNMTIQERAIHFEGLATGKKVSGILGKDADGAGITGECVAQENLGSHGSGS